jgi:hypothetical protein
MINRKANKGSRLKVEDLKLRIQSSFGDSLRGIYVYLFGG